MHTRGQSGQTRSPPAEWTHDNWMLPSRLERVQVGGYILYYFLLKDVHAGA